MVDQHFSQRGRLGRLIVAALFAKKELAFGIDEDTAMVVDNRNRLISVVGAHGLTIVDLSKVRHEGTPSRIAVRDILVTYLEKGSTCRLDNGEPVPGRTVSASSGEEVYVAKGPVFDEVKNLLTRDLAAPDRKEAVGLASELTGAGGGEGYLVSFRKGAGTALKYQAAKDLVTREAVYVHMDLIPVTLRLEDMEKKQR